MIIVNGLSGRPHLRMIRSPQPASWCPRAPRRLCHQRCVLPPPLDHEQLSLTFTRSAVCAVRRRLSREMAAAPPSRDAINRRRRMGTFLSHEFVSHARPAERARRTIRPASGRRQNRRWPPAPPPSQALTQQPEREATTSTIAAWPISTPRLNDSNDTQARSPATRVRSTLANPNPCTSPNSNATQILTSRPRLPQQVVAPTNTMLRRSAAPPRVTAA